MIELSPLARPYAKAIFAAALDLGNHELVAKDLALLSVVSQTKEVSSLIEDPELSKEHVRTTDHVLAQQADQHARRQVQRRPALHGQWG